ncbi:endomucin isoform X1 [Trachemys scripta elegans]|uniref:endomucin isoform X1 n=1 Tax=Trachemys scripta elegans TaxID=31138 RepID=UPI001555D286|nr:endomucin isoform X1 [Trachemys scripta elegans]
MKLLGAALLSLAVFSICTANVQENSSMTPPSKNTQWTPAQENSSMTPTSKNSQSTTVSSESTITISSSTNVSAGKTESLPGSSVMAASDSTRMTAGSHWTSTLTPSHGSPGSNDKQADNDQYSSIILPVVIALIVITLSVFILVALIRMCRRTTTEGQENGTEQATTDKEGVKLLSVKTASPETVFVAVHDLCAVGFSLPSANLYEIIPTPTGEVSQVKITGEHSSQGKNRTHQHDESSSHLGNKYM